MHFRPIASVQRQSEDNDENLFSSNTIVDFTIL